MTQPVRPGARALLALLSLTLVLAACGQAGSITEPTTSVPAASAPIVSEPATSTAATTSTPDSNSVAATDFDLNSWDSVLTAARGQTVNWYLWGGSDSINQFVDTFYGKPLQEQYGVTLNRVPLADTVDAVNQVLSEQEAGKNQGAVDMIWINGENFASLKQAGMLYDGWNRRLPNSSLVDYENPALNLDFGTPIGEMESMVVGAIPVYLRHSAHARIRRAALVCRAQRLFLPAPGTCDLYGTGAGSIPGHALRQRRAV